MGGKRSRREEGKKKRKTKVVEEEINANKRHITFLF